MQILYVTLIGLFAGLVSTSVGSILPTLLGRKAEKYISLMLGIAAGVMVALVFADLMPEAVHAGNLAYPRNNAGMLIAYTGFLAGALSMTLIDKMLPHRHFTTLEPHVNVTLYKTGLLTALGIALHNLPEGLAIGAGYAHSSELGFTLFVAIALHNLPEGLALGTPLAGCGICRWKVLTIGAAAGLPMALGAFLGAVFGMISPAMVSVSLGIAAGAMLYIVADELIPESQKSAIGHSGTYGTVIGSLLGLLLIYFV